MIDQPCLVIFGTAIPNHYYEALSERMLTNGFFARMIILECGQRSPGQEPGILPSARARAGDRPDGGPTSGPARATWRTGIPCRGSSPHTEEARALLIETRLEAEAEYAKAEGAAIRSGRPSGDACSEHTRKLALVYAVSENHERPEIGTCGRVLGEPASSCTRRGGCSSWPRPTSPTTRSTPSA